MSTPCIASPLSFNLVIELLYTVLSVPVEQAPVSVRHSLGKITHLHQGKIEKRKYVVS